LLFPPRGAIARACYSIAGAPSTPTRASLAGAAGSAEGPPNIDALYINVEIT
jgi:hypothetical protein